MSTPEHRAKSNHDLGSQGAVPAATTGPLSTVEEQVPQPETTLCSLCSNGGAPYGATVEIVGGAATSTPGIKLSPSLMALSGVIVNKPYMIATTPP